MNRLVFIVLSVLSILGCTSEQVTENSHEMVTLRFSPYVIESMTRAVTSISDYCTRLDVWFVEGANVQTIHQTAEDDDFGNVTITLNKTKTYNIIAVGHKCTDVATLNNNVISFPDGKLTHAMVYSSSFTPASTSAVDCIMNRIVGMFRLETTDALSGDCSKMTFAFTCNDKWNVASGMSSNEQSKTVTINITSTHDDGTVALSFYIMPDNLTATKEVDIVATAYTLNNTVIQHKTFSSVPVKAGYKTTYRGAFFTDAPVTYTFTANDWNNFDTINF